MFRGDPSRHRVGIVQNCNRGNDPRFREHAMYFFRDAGTLQLCQVGRVFHYAIFHNSGQSQTDSINRSTVAHCAHGLLTHQFKQAIQRRVQQCIRVFCVFRKMEQARAGLFTFDNAGDDPPGEMDAKTFSMIQISSTVLLRRFRPLKAAAL